MVYNIDGHCSSLSTKMLLELGIDPVGHSGFIRRGHERVQGRLTDIIGAAVTCLSWQRAVPIFRMPAPLTASASSVRWKATATPPRIPATALIVRLARTSMWAFVFTFSISI